MRRWRAAVAAVVLMAIAAGCGGDGGDSAGSGDGSVSGEVVSAVLGIITTNIDTDTGGGFVDATEGEELTVGDRVKTDATGFAEVTYHEGSWMRVESSATLTIEDLADADAGEVVSTSIDTGEAWSRVVELSEPEDEFVVDTPVASAAVRGTAFAIDCEGDTACTFGVVEGEVLVTPDVGDPVTLTAGQRLTVTAGEEPPAPEEPGVAALSGEPFIAKNLELDAEKAAEGDGDGGGGDDETAAPLEPPPADVCGLTDAAAVRAYANAVMGLYEVSSEPVSAPATPEFTYGATSPQLASLCVWSFEYAPEQGGVGGTGNVQVQLERVDPVEGSPCDAESAEVQRLDVSVGTSFGCLGDLSLWVTHSGPIPPDPSAAPPTGAEQLLVGVLTAASRS